MMATPQPFADPQVLVAIVSAAAATIRTWLQTRSQEQAKEAARTAAEEARDDPAVLYEARVLEDLVPPEILAQMIERVETCWKRYSEVLEGDDFLPTEIDGATEAVKACICRELRRLKSVNRTIPGGKLKDWWSAYCEVA